MNKERILQSLKKLRENKERKFEQSVDLIINLRKVDLKKNPINLIIEVPHKVKEKNICGFFEKKIEGIETITKKDIEGYDKKKAKKLVKKYDFFIASPALMPNVATTFGKYLGPAGKMPSPQIGIVKEDPEEIKKLRERINRVIKIKTEEPSIKVIVGKEKMKNEEIAENILKVYEKVVESLPDKAWNVKSVLVKFTMSKPEVIEKKGGSEVQESKNSEELKKDFRR